MVKKTVSWSMSFLPSWPNNFKEIVEITSIHRTFQNGQRCKNKSLEIARLSHLAPTASERQDSVWWGLLFPEVGGGYRDRLHIEDGKQIIYLCKVLHFSLPKYGRRHSCLQIWPIFHNPVGFPLNSSKYIYLSHLSIPHWSWVPQAGRIWEATTLARPRPSEGTRFNTIPLW